MFKLLVSSYFRAAVLGGAVAAFAAIPAQAGGLKDAPMEAKRPCALSGTMALTSDYVFRGVSFTNEEPAIQGSVDVTCGLFYTGAWASSIGDIDSQNTIEIDYYGGVTPKFQGFDFDFGVIYYTYPGVTDASDADYWELKAGVSRTFMEKLTLGVTYFYADEVNGGPESHTVEGSWEFGLPKVSIFSPKLSGVIGFQDGDANGTSAAAIELEDFVNNTYWSVGLSADFHERWTVDLRYWDTDEDTPGVTSDIFEERFVGTISASF